MNTILVWILVSTSYRAGVQYSPPVERIEDCQQIQKFIARDPETESAQCIQVRYVQGHK